MAIEEEGTKKGGRKDDQRSGRAFILPLFSSLPSPSAGSALLVLRELSSLLSCLPLSALKSSPSLHSFAIKGKPELRERERERERAGSRPQAIDTTRLTRRRRRRTKVVLNRECVRALYGGREQQKDRPTGMAWPDQREGRKELCEL